MEHEATGTFEIKLTPTTPENSPISTMSLDKVYSGDLTATSTGHMLAFRSAVEGSAGYVAMERITGTLAGRKGSFTLQHNGLMDKGTPTLTVIVVPDSATEALQGLTGELTIIITPGRHDYHFKYALPA